MTETFAWPPPYTIRRSKRARHLHIHLKPYKPIEVVIPWRVSQKEGLEFLNSRRAWIEKHSQKINVAANFMQEAVKELPQKLVLAALNQIWDISYQATAEPRIRFWHEDNTLILAGQVDNHALCFKALHLWLKKMAQTYLTPLLQELATEHRFIFSKVSYRAQKTMWGSCSHKKVIHLNYKLLFLPYEIVRYVMLHELCHTLYLDHSPRFWNYLSQFDPQCLYHRKSLRQADQFIPTWFLIE